MVVREKMRPEGPEQQRAVFILDILADRADEDDEKQSLLPTNHRQIRGSVVQARTILIRSRSGLRRF